MPEQTNVSVVGLGKLGCPMVACFASKGHRVIGVDNNPRIVELVSQGKSPVQEPGVDRLLNEFHERIEATTDLQAAVADTDLTFIVVPTPTDETGGFSNRYVLAAAEGVGRALARKKGFHLVVLTSTVMPGTMTTQFVPALESASGKRCAKDFGVCYNPEFIALGSVIHDMLHPDFTLIGESDSLSGELLSHFYESICEGELRACRMSFVNAELTKIAVNTFVTTKISYANMLSEVCDRLPSADVEVVTKAIGYDTRVGSKYFRGATAYGGPCFPRDNVAFCVMARTVGVDAAIAQATDTVNRRQFQRITEMLASRLPSGATVGILGLAYKTNTSVVEASHGIEVTKGLLALGFSVCVFDPQAMDSARRELGDNVLYASSVSECVLRSDGVAIMLPYSDFASIERADVIRNGKRIVLVDCWRILDSGRFADICEYVVPGQSPGLS